MNIAHPKRLHTALPTLAAWVACFRTAPIPVMAGTAAAIGELIDHEDAVDAHTIAESIGADPLMTLKLLSHVGTVSRRETPGRRRFRRWRWGGC